MSQQNVKLVRRLVDTWNSTGDPSLRAYDEDAEFDFSGWDFAVQGTWRGIAAIKQALTGVRDAWEDMRVEAEEFIDAGEKVVFFARFYARRAGSGLEVSDAGTCVFTIRDGRVAGFNLFRDRRAALAAVGLKEAGEETQLA
jgi:ketosteroid isomerase-like protein